MTRAYPRQTLIAGLRGLGVAPGRDLLVHSSLRAVGAVAGGAATVLRALEEAAGHEATIVVPTHTTWNSRSSRSFLAAMEGLGPGEREHYLARMPGFDPLTTPSSGMGALAEYVRTSARAVRSDHPQTSFAAVGPGAAQCTAGHPLECHLGESSPVGWLARQDAMVLLLGVGYAACTAFHLAEYRLPGNRPRRAYHCRVLEDDVRRECEFWDVELDDSDFAALGARMDGAGFVRHGRVGSAESRLIPIRSAVEFALRDPSFRRRRAADLSRVRMVMTQQLATAVPGRYFFLSYPRLWPLAPVAGADLADPPDEWVRAFFRDLSLAVRRRAGPGSALRPGFLDLAISPGPAQRAAITGALADAEVFVPLLSPDYSRRSWPQRESASFWQRMLDAGIGEPHRRWVPVLWVPFPSGDRRTGLTAALSLARGAGSAAYAENGLRALSRLTPYRALYEQITAEAAARIVSTAENAPVGPSQARDPEDAESHVRGETGCAEFVVMTAGPGLPGGTEYVRWAAEKAGFAVIVDELGKSSSLIGRGPGIVLVDPGSVTGEEDLEEFRRRVEELPSWVVPVIVTEQSSGHRLNMIRACLEKSYRSYGSYKYKPELSQGLHGVSSLREFVALLPFAVTRSEREYLRHGPIQRSAGRTAFRPRLAGHGGSADQSAEEDPHV